MHETTVNGNPKQTIESLGIERRYANVLTDRYWDQLDGTLPPPDAFQDLTDQEPCRMR